MPVIPLTVIGSLCLVFTFLVFFLRVHARGQVSSVERDALLPFADETSHVIARRNGSRAGSDRQSEM